MKIPLEYRTVPTAPSATRTQFGSCSRNALDFDWSLGDEVAIIAVLSAARAVYLGRQEQSLPRGKRYFSVPQRARPGNFLEVLSIRHAVSAHPWRASSTCRPTA